MSMKHDNLSHWSPLKISYSVDVCLQNWATGRNSAGASGGQTSNRLKQVCKKLQQVVSPSAKIIANWSIKELQQVVGQFSETDPSKNWLNKFCNNLKVAKNHWQSICQKVGFQHLIKAGLLEQLQLCRMHAACILHIACIIPHAAAWQWLKKQ